jgi:hypothetical protein
MNNKLPMPTDKGWRWERVYRGQTLTVETYRQMGLTLSEAAPAVTAQMWIKGDCNHYEKHSDYETSPCEYCEQGMGYLEFLVEEKLGVDEDEKVTA